jgi:hypothetical protein
LYKNVRYEKNCDEFSFCRIAFAGIFFGTNYTEADAAKLEAKKKAEEEKAALPKPYNETENAEAKIAELVKKAEKENKNVMIQAGGNWCIWCLDLIILCKLHQN